MDRNAHGARSPQGRHRAAGRASQAVLVAAAAFGGGAAIAHPGHPGPHLPGHALADAGPLAVTLAVGVLAAVAIIGLRALRGRREARD